MKSNRLIAILGGMGPDASARLVSRIVDLSRKVGEAVNSDDYPNFLMHNIPVPDFFDNPKLYETGLNVLINSVKQIEKLKPQYFAIACNTVHSVLPELKKVTKIPFLNLPEIVALQSKHLGFRRVGLLATPLTYKSKIYINAFNNLDISVVEPKTEDKKKLGQIVHMILKGEFSKAKNKLVVIADTLFDKKIDAIILGCTELPLVFPKKHKVIQISSIECLASDIVTRYYV